MKGYGKQYKVCYKHRSIIAAAVCKMGNCAFCDATVNGMGSPPKLCNKCSIQLNQCKYCGINLDES